MTDDRREQLRRELAEYHRQRREQHEQDREGRPEPSAKPEPPPRDDAGERARLLRRLAQETTDELYAATPYDPVELPHPDDITRIAAKIFHNAKPMTSTWKCTLAIWTADLADIKTDEPQYLFHAPLREARRLRSKLQRPGAKANPAFLSMLDRAGGASGDPDGRAAQQARRDVLAGQPERRGGHAGTVTSRNTLVIFHKQSNEIRIATVYAGDPNAAGTFQIRPVPQEKMKSSKPNAPIWLGFWHPDR